VDYRVLLKKYMSHVWDQEGITFVDMVDMPNGGISPEEFLELKKIEDEIELQNELED
jgi:hypothetical protein